MKDVEFSYSARTNDQLLKIKYWQVKQGQQIFLHGPSGSGKSTLLNLICGLITADTGSINILGESFDGMSSHQRDKYRAKHIGYIFQQFNLIDYLSAIDNIKLAQYFSSQALSANFLEEIEQLLSNLHLSEHEFHRPVKQLSVGQQQRVGIARALINKPKLIIADEPTSSLDHSSRDSFIEILSSLCLQQNASLVFVSHDMSLRDNFDSSIALDEINNVGN